MLLIWDTKGALGMGDLSLPWKPSHQEIYILGRGFQGKRTSDVLSFAPVQSIAKNGRLHPHQKPLGLMRDLINKCPSGVVYDPCMGVGSTLVAAKLEGREAIGVEIEERYCELAARRLDNEPRPMF
ncbi:MAG: site-specific DNA-methyltransferase [Planctomycetota bacterium]